MTTGLRGAPVLVVGAGIMGVGIVQVAALAGHRVWLFDMREGAAAQAVAKLGATFDGLVAKGRLDAAAARDALARVQPIDSLADARGAGLVVEAIVEKLDAKRALFQQLEAIVADEAVLATNTSSISVTAIANGLRRPQRLVGMHFFNPVPLMKLVEVVSGLQTDCHVAQAVFELGMHWGKKSVHARSTPGFIVNRIARPFYAESLALLQEQAATPQVLDTCLKAAGFRMGPCELMDLIGHDTNFAVTQSVYEANFFDKRYVPSGVQREMVDGGLLGRKSGRGFYAHGDAAAAGLPVAVHDAPQTAHQVTVHGHGALADALEQAAATRTRGAGLGPGARARQQLDRAVGRRRAPRADRRPHRAAARGGIRHARPRRLRPPARPAAAARHGARVCDGAPGWSALAGAGAGLAGRTRLHAAAGGRRAGPGGRAHAGDAGQ